VQVDAVGQALTAHGQHGAFGVQRPPLALQYDQEVLDALGVAVVRNLDGLYRLFRRLLKSLLPIGQEARGRQGDLDFREGLNRLLSETRRRFFGSPLLRVDPRPQASALEQRLNEIARDGPDQVIAV